MSDDRLSAALFLGGYARRFGATELREVTDMAVVSLAVPLGQAAALAEALQTSYQLAAPAVGEVSQAPGGQVRGIGLASDQFFMLFDQGGIDADREVADRLGGTAYVTLQSDNWVALRLTGPATLPALERVCPLDLDLTAFPVDRVARTVMEHLGAILVREAPDRFLLMSASSSAQAFLEALETSLRYVVE